MAFGHTFFYCIIILASFREAYSLIIARDENNITETFFTTELNVFGAAEGVLVEADPVDACRNISPSHFNLSVGCFVLISEGSCGIEEKIFNAYAAKYSAAIIYHVEAPDIALARRLHSQIPVSPNITVVLVNRHAGSRLAEKFLYTTSPKSRIYIYPSTVFNIFAFLMLFAVVAATFIFTMLLFLIIRCIQQSRQRRRNRLSTRHLRQIPTARYRHGDPYETCAICLEDYKEKDKLRILPCSHGYHCKCIDPWLTNNKRTCPVCKQKVVLPGVHSDEDSSSSDTESRAETTPLIRETVRRPVSHGTFNNSYDIPGINRHSSNALQQASGETTSRDAPSDVLDESSDEEKQVSTIRTCSSAPGTLAFACEEQQPAAADLYAGAPLPPSPSNISCNGAGGDNVCVVSPGSAAGNSSVTKSKHNSFKTYVV